MANLDFYKSFERITKALVLKMAEGDYETAIETIDWLDKRLQKLFELVDKNQELFYQIFDPEGHFEVRQVEESPFKNLDLADLLSSDRISVSSLPIKRGFPSLMDQKIDIGQSGRNRDSKSFLEKLLLLFYSIWDSARNIRGYSIDLYIGQVYHNLMVYISQMNNDKIETKSVLESLFKIFENQTLELKKGRVDLEFIWRVDLANSVGLIFKNSFPTEYSITVQGHIFNVLVSTFDGDLVLQKRYITYITSAHRIPLSSDFSRLLDDIHSNEADELANGDLEQEVFQERERVISKVKYLDDSSIDDLKSLSSAKDKVSEFFDADWVKNQMTNEDAWRVEKELDRLDTVYKANLEKNTLYLILLYSLSQDRFDYVNYVFENNTPHKLSSSWSSPEYAPIQLQQTLDIFLNRTLQNNNTLIFESDKYQTDHLVNMLILFSIKYVLYYEYRFYVKKEVIIQGYFSKLSPEQLKSFEYRLENLKAIVKREKIKWKDDNFSEQTITSIQALLDKLSGEVQKCLEELEKYTPIPEQTISNLIKGTEDNICDKSIFLKLVSEFGEITTPEDTTQFDDKKGHIGVYINEVHFRRSFLPDWPVPTYGTIDNFSEQIRSTLDLVLYRKIKESFDQNPSNEFEVVEDSNDFLEQVKQQNFEIVLFRNYHPGSIFRKTHKFTPNFKVEGDEFKTFGNRFVGLLNRTPIFWYIDPFKDQNEAIFFNQSDIGTIEILRTQETEDADHKNRLINAQTFDLPFDPEAMQKILDESPNWLEREAEETGKSADEILREKIWIKIFTYLKYVPAKKLGVTKTIKLAF